MAFRRRAVFYGWLGHRYVRLKGTESDLIVKVKVKVKVNVRPRTGHEDPKGGVDVYSTVSVCTTKSTHAVSRHPATSPHNIQ